MKLFRTVWLIIFLSFSDQSGQEEVRVEASDQGEDEKAWRNQTVYQSYKGEFSENFFC